MFNGLQHAGVRPRLAAVLTNSVVLLYRTYQLASFKGVVRAVFFYVHIFPGLARPDGHQRVPMIGRGDGDGVDIFVLEELANIDIGFGLWQALLLDVAEALVQHAFIHIAQSANLCSRHAGETLNMVVATTAYSANCDADTIVCAEYLAAQCNSGRAPGYSFSRRFKKVTPLDCHNCRLCSGSMLQAA